MGHYEDIQINRREGWKYQSTHGTNGDDYYAKVYVGDDGKITEDSYSLQYRKKLKEEKEKNEVTASSSSSSSRSSSNSSSSNSDDNGSCVKFIFTIIPVLPIWWIIKLFIKGGAGFFVILWWLLKAVLYIVTWPIRIFLYCCLDKEERRFLPKWNYDFIPAYSFKKF